ncbi:MAG: DUF11 domain-containing protein [Gammaproteobacteria bacterium]|nr:DUF11 domain-containing protein [Gammaproteobacteria bacterium]
MLWIVNSGSTGVRDRCINWLLAVEKIDKQNPPGDVATVGVPFTYRLVIPVLYTPDWDQNGNATGTIDYSGSPNELHSVFVTDDLNETGVDLVYESHTVTWANTGAPVSHSFSNVGGVLTFDVDPIIPPSTQIYVDITVRLLDTPTNSVGTQFINIARWQFGRILDGTLYEPLPGENGISPPITIGGPDIVMTKTGPDTLGTTLNLGEWGEFRLDLQNVGTTDAWNVWIQDVLPNGPVGGMCDTTPEILNAQVFANDGVTAVPGKGPLVEGVDYSFRFSTSCSFFITALTPAATIGAGERLVIDYRTRLDADSQDGATLRNVAAARRWFNDAPDNSGRVRYLRRLDNGSPGIIDHADDHVVTVDLYGYFFEKTAENLTQGNYPALVAEPDDILRYTLRVQTTDGPLDDVQIIDDLGAYNGAARFVPGSLSINGAIPPGAVDNSDPTGGTNGDGLIDVSNIDIPESSEITIQYDVQLASGLVDGTIVTNQAGLYAASVKLVDSDDPFVNGQSSPDVMGDEDPTIVLIEAEQPVGLAKTTSQSTATIGEEFSYQITIPSAPHTAPLYDVRILDDLDTGSVADLEFVNASVVSGPGSWTLQNTGDSTIVVLEDLSGGIDIPTGEQAVFEITVRLQDTATNVAGLEFTNTASYTYNIIDGTPATERPGIPGTSGPMTVVEPELTLEKTGPPQMRVGTPATFTLNVHNVGESPAWNVTIGDLLANQVDGGTCDAAPQNITAQVFESNGTTPVSGVLVDGVDYTVTFDGAPNCTLTLNFLTPDAAIAADQRLLINYDATLDAGSQENAALTNIAGATEWFGLDVSDAANQPYARTYTEVITNGTVGTLDHEDAHTTEVFTPVLVFEKTAINMSTGENPATVASPGDTIRYTLRVENAGDTNIADFQVIDELDSLNVLPYFQPGTLNVVTLPGGAVDSSNPNGGVAGTGLLDVGGLDLNGLGTSVTVEFEVQLAPVIADGTTVLNQSQAYYSGFSIALSDDPNINGAANPNIDGDEDPTAILIEAEQPVGLGKATTQATAAIGETFSYQVAVPSVAHTAPLYDVRIFDDLAASAADLEFVSVSKVSPGGTWTPQNTGDATSLVIEDPVDGIDIPAGEQAIIEITVRLLDTATNVAGLEFTNTAYYTYNLVAGDPLTERPGDPGTSGPMTIVEPELTLEKTGPLQMSLGDSATFTLNVHNTGDSPAWNVTVEDLLANQVDGGTCDAAPTNITAQLFEADGTTPVSAALVDGVDYTATFDGDPNCTLTFDFLTPDAAIGADQRLLVTYEAALDADTQENAALTNIAGATEWFSLDVADANNTPYARTYTEVITDGTVDTLDHEDAHTTTIFTPVFIFEKVAANVTTNEDPATTATPGDTIRYTLRVENVNGTNIDFLSVVDELDSLNASPYFQPGTLNVVTLPDGATDNSEPNGGAAGTGLLNIVDLGSAGVGDTITIEFEVDLAPVIPNGTVVLNQSELRYADSPIAISDDPGIDGDEDPTEILIESAPYFDVDKISSYIDGDPAVLLAGETLRYTITVQNTGTDNATNVYMTDLVPSNTTYVAGSTTLNGSPVADGPNGSPLIEGITLGDLPAGAPTVTVVFDVVVYPDVPDGTIISNQAFVSAPDQGLGDVPSDDPRTELVDDPTRDVVGNYPLLYALKTAALQVDNGSPGIVDPGDTLRYTVTIYNNGNVPATMVELFDNVPLDTTYVADSTTLDGSPVGQPDNGVFPLEGRILVGTNGTLDPGASTTVQFDLLVDAGVARGTQITNQATVYSAEVANLLSDSDGDPSNGNQPTVVIVGDAQFLSIVKDVAVVGGGAAIPGATLQYTVTVQNVGTVPALYVLLRDDLDEVNPGYIAYVDQSATLNGLTTGVSVAGQIITADYFTDYGPLEPGEIVTLRFQAVIDANLVEGTTIANTARVYWDDPQQTAEATAYIDVGAMPDAGMLSGNVWHDADHDNTPDGVERPLELWTVELLLNGQLVRTAQTDADGYYLFTNVMPNYAAGETYSLRFAAPGATATTALLGETDSDFTDGRQRIDDIDVQEGSNLLALNMPVDPNGVIYDSITRGPIPGAVVRLLDARNSLPLPDTCFEDPNQQGQVTIGNGYYKFDINFGNSSCPGPGNYLIQVTEPSVAYVPGVSAMIPPTSDLSTLPFDVPSCPASVNDAVLATAQHCEAQPSEFAPAVSVPARSAATNYHLFLRLDSEPVPETSQLFNNHIPLDPRLDGAVAVTKTTPMLHATRGQLVPYVITVSNSFGADLRDVNIVDRFPAGFKYVEGSARFDDLPAEPAIAGRELVWTDLLLQTDGRHEIKLLLAVGAGVTEGEFVNRAFAMNGLTGAVMSAEAQAKVRIIPDPTFDCTDVTGKVFNDSNRNGYQDGDEGGLQGVRVVTAKGLAATTDAHGRYHITCAIVPNESRGSNFVLKLDDRTLPSGFRPSTRPVQVQRATRGKALRVNFGASIHRVVGLDIADPVFEPDSIVVRQQWQPRIGLLLDELRKAPAVLRLSYVADLEPESLVNDRLAALKERIMDEWRTMDGGYELVVEPEVHWRLGGPVKQPQGGEQ